MRTITAVTQDIEKSIMNEPRACKFLASRIVPPLVIAHRGYSALYPENTMPAFQAAVEAGADMVEFDVRLTRDRRLAVIHDDTVDRTTDGRGYVRELGLGEILHLDAGSWFGPTFTGTRVPNLESVLSFLAGRCLMNLELKTSPDASYSDKSALACAALGMVRSRGLMDSALFSSFDHGMLRLIRRLEPYAQLGVLAEGLYDLGPAMDLVSELDAVSLHPRAGLMEKVTVGALHEQNRLVLAWAGEGEDTGALMLRALALGADGFFTNEVKALVRAVRDFRRAV